MIAALALFLLPMCGACFFPDVYYRSWESIRDVGTSFAYYATAFGENPVHATVTGFPRDFLEALPREWAAFLAWGERFGKLLISPANLAAYGKKLLFGILISFMCISFSAPFVVLPVFLFAAMLQNRNHDVGAKSRPLRAFLKIRDKIFTPIRRYLAGLKQFFTRRKWLRYILLLCVLYFFNLLNVALEAIAYLLYFSASFDLINLFVQCVKLLSDLAPMVRFVPLPLWIIAGVYVLCKLRRRIAFKTLRKYEQKNLEFSQKLNLALLISGTMGKGKTMLAQSLAQTMEDYFRQSAFETMRAVDAQFPRFPWPRFEEFLKRNARKHTLYNLTTIRSFFELQRYYYGPEASKPDARAWRTHVRKKYGYAYHGPFFGYDKARFGTEYDDGLKYVDLFDAMTDYACAFHIYTLPSSQIVANYGIRSDKALEDEGNLPRFDHEYFDVPTARADQSNMAHIIDFDAFRLGLHVKEDNPLSNFFEFGIVVITEIGKERGNQNDLKGLEKNDENANQKNDLFNPMIKLIRHSSTVANFPYARFICDEQRAENWGADARDLCDILDICDVAPEKIVLPFFFFEEALYLLASKIFRKIYYERFRFRRGDETLTIYFLKWLYARIVQHYGRVSNTFSVSKMHLTKQDGKQEKAPEPAVWYKLSKKDKALRYSTDCYSGFFKKRTAASPYGLNDIPTYKNIKPTYEELQSQNSYFINGISAAFEGKAAKPKKSEKKNTEDSGRST